MNYQLLGKSGLRISVFLFRNDVFRSGLRRGSPQDEARKIYDAFREQGRKLRRTGKTARPSK